MNPATPRQIADRLERLAAQLRRAAETEQELLPGNLLSIARILRVVGQDVGDLKGRLVLTYRLFDLAEDLDAIVQEGTAFSMSDLASLTHCIQQAADRARTAKQPKTAEA